MLNAKKRANKYFNLFQTNQQFKNIVLDVNFSYAETTTIFSKLFPELQVNQLEIEGFYLGLRGLSNRKTTDAATLFF